MPKIQTRAKRAASKQALNRLHQFLGNDDKVVVSSDDDVIEVDTQPPKKKYKLSHRKSSDGNDRDVIVLKTVSNPNDPLLDLECEVEDVCPSQKKIKEKIETEVKEMDGKVQQLLKSTHCEVFFKGYYTTGMEINEKLQTILNSLQQVPRTMQPQQHLQPVPPPQGPQQQSYQLVMDPRLGLIVGAVPTNTTTPPQFQSPPSLQPIPQQQLYQTKMALQQQQQQLQANMQLPPPLQQQPMRTRRGTYLKQSPGMPSPGNATTPNKNMLMKSTAGTTTPKNTVTVVNNKPGQMQTNSPRNAASQFKIPQTKSSPSQLKTIQLKTPQGLHIKPIQPKNMSTLQVKTIQSINKGSQQQQQNKDLQTVQRTKTRSSLGDLSEETRQQLADSKEISFNKLQGRTFPSLVVVARPHLRVKELSSDRSKLDAKVKSVLMYPPTKFTEWLIQQGLLRSDQTCSQHPTKPLKLGMYSDASKFPFSGGYVWISDCCPMKFVSVFSGSLFEGTQHPPISILKLIYHWCCQTIVQNVTQWVKVDNLYVKGMYTLLRGVCTVAIHSHMKPMGGPGIKVEVGVISLGTTSQDGNQRQVKVEVLGVLETTTKLIRLRAVEPLTDVEKTYKKRFTKILEPVMQWVHPQSIIVTDLTVDKISLRNMGFANIIQTTSVDYNNSNRTIMEYLRRIVPRMFQNTLSLLSRPIIQQFLDELVWREWYGTTVLQCFDNLVLHLSEQTRSNSQASLVMHLNKVSSNPFRNWPMDNNTNSNNNSNILVEPKRYTRTRKINPPQSYYNDSVATVSAPSSSSQSTSSSSSTNTAQTQSFVPTTSTTVSRPVKSMSPDLPGEQLVPLESYYYGSVDAEKQINKPKLVLNIKCSFCKLVFTNNISLMSHLFKHAHSVTNDVHICRYCLTIVPTAHILSKHINTTHPAETKFNNSFLCLICEADFMNPFMLGKHMSKEHCPYELPYLCGTCNFRCSNHKMAVDHFYKHHSNGPSMQCPFCLKSVNIYSGGRNVVQNMTYFIHHLQKHQKKVIAKKCGKCNLWFVQKDVLKDHLARMHVSQRGKFGLVPFAVPKNGIMVPKSRLDRRPVNVDVINFSNIHFNVNRALMCKECHKPMNISKHFQSFETCEHCPYSTCCRNAMSIHLTKCKSSNPILPPEKLPVEMFCICEFSSKDGNIMAKHLTTCERKSAYPSLEAAKKATVTHSMLDVLGLVRKPDETTTTNNSTNNNNNNNVNKETNKLIDISIDDEIQTIDDDDDDEDFVPPQSIKNQSKSQVKLKDLESLKKTPAKIKITTPIITSTIHIDDDDEDDVVIGETVVKNEKDTEVNDSSSSTSDKVIIENNVDKISDQEEEKEKEKIEETIEDRIEDKSNNESDKVIEENGDEKMGEENSDEKIEENSDKRIEESPEEKIEENSEKKIEESCEEKIEENSEKRIEESPEEKIEENSEKKIEESCEEKIEENSEKKIEESSEENSEKKIEESSEENSENKIEENSEERIEENLEDKIEEKTEDTIENKQEETIEDKVEETIDENTEDKKEEEIEENNIEDKMEDETILNQLDNEENLKENNDDSSNKEKELFDNKIDNEDKLLNDETIESNKEIIDNCNDKQTNEPMDID